MPKGKHLSDVEQGQILAHKRDGLTTSEIAVAVGRSYDVVRKFLKNPEAYGTRARPGRPAKLSKRDRRKLLRAAKQDGMTSKRLKAELSLPVSDRTVRRELHNAPYMKWGKRIKTPKLAARHRQTRCDWARKMIRERVDWNNVVFSDEKKFNLDGPDGAQYYWHDLRAEKETFFSRQNGGGSIMVWGGISARGTTVLAILSGRQDSFDYQQTLTTHLLPFGDEVYDGNYVFQHDNASIHASRATQEFIQDINVKVLEWPSLSPDLNPVENVWGELVRAVYRGGRQYNSVDELKVAVLREWSRLDQDWLRRLVASMPDRCIDVIEKRGGKTKY